MRHHKYHTRHSFPPFGQILEDFFNKSLGDIVGGDISFNTPNVNAFETEEAYFLEVAAPGVKKEDFNITLEGEHLVVSAQTTDNEAGPEYRRREFDYSKFSRSFKLQDDIETSKISASYDLGVLTIELPKYDASNSNKQTTITID